MMQSDRSYEALYRAIKGRMDEVARRLCISKALLYKWTEPSTDYTDSGALNPLDRIEVVIETALLHGNNDEDAIAPLQYLNERFNLVAVPLPDTECDSERIAQQLVNSIKEFSDLAASASKSLQDNKVSIPEFRNIKREGWQAIRAIAQLMLMAEEACDK